MVSKIYILTSAILLLAIVIDGDNRIFGGHSALKGQFPYQVSLQYAGNKTHLCGGSILNSKWILTAAHCVTGLNESDCVIEVGATVLSYEGTYHRIARFVIYEGHIPMPFLRKDIAVIELRDEIRFSNFAQKINLETAFIGETYAVVSGWGLIHPGQFSANLQYLFVKTSQQCLFYADADEICTMPEYGSGFCSGDSGGPLVANGKQIGVVSSFRSACGSGYPDVYVRVSSYIEWINNVTSNVI